MKTEILKAAAVIVVISLCGLLLGSSYKPAKPTQTPGTLALDGLKVETFNHLSFMGDSTQIDTCVQVVSTVTYNQDTLIMTVNETPFGFKPVEHNENILICLDKTKTPTAFIRIVDKNTDSLAIFVIRKGENGILFTKTDCSTLEK